METITPTKIAIIDDSKVNLKVLETLLKKCGWEVYQAMDGKNGIDLITTVVPDLILLDIMMPGMDGFEVCQRLKQMPHVKDIPIIFISALTDNKSIMKGLELGAVDYISKPFLHTDVISRVELHLKPCQTSQDIKQS